MPISSAAPVEPVAIWHDLSVSGYLLSELGLIEGLPIATPLHHHCADREVCTAVEKPLGRCLLFSATLIADLDAGSRRYNGLQANRRGDFVDLVIDHVGASDAVGRWTYRLVPLRWRNNDPPGHSDPELCLSIWPD